MKHTHTYSQALFDVEPVAAFTWSLNEDGIPVGVAAGAQPDGPVDFVVDGRVELKSVQVYEWDKDRHPWSFFAEGLNDG